MFFNLQAMKDFICFEASQQYRNSSSNPNAAPAVGEWLDQILERAEDGTLTMAEMMQLQRLKDSEGWIHASYAQNTAYKAMERFGAIPTGMNSF